MARRAFCIERLQKSNSDPNPQTYLTLWSCFSDSRSRYQCQKTISCHQIGRVTLHQIIGKISNIANVWCGRTRGRADGRTHTHRFLEPLYTISPSGKNSPKIEIKTTWIPLSTKKGVREMWTGSDIVSWFWNHRKKLE